MEAVNRRRNVPRLPAGRTGSSKESKELPFCVTTEAVGVGRCTKRRTRFGGVTATLASGAKLSATICAFARPGDTARLFIPLGVDFDSDVWGVSLDTAFAHVVHAATTRLADEV